MNYVITGVVAALQILLCALLAPGLIGVMRTVRARMEGRYGAGIVQPYRDFAKLLRKRPVMASATLPLIMIAAPLLLVVSSLAIAVLVPIITVQQLPWLGGDLFATVSVLLLGTVALALLGWESGSAFGGMGSSRHMMVAALVEPTLLMSCFALSVRVGSSNIATIVVARLDHPMMTFSPVSLLAIVALIIVVLAETGRLPVDNPSTHLELTMIHEAMILESSGRDLAWIELGSWLRLTVLLGWVMNLIIPAGIATTAAPLAVAIGIASAVGKILLGGALIAAVEVFTAKLRLFRVPELLAGSFVLAFLAATASYLVVP